MVAPAACSHQAESSRHTNRTAAHAAADGRREAGDADDKHRAETTEAERRTTKSEHTADVSIEDSAVQAAVLRIVVGSWLNMLSNEESQNGQYNGQADAELEVLLSALHGLDQQLEGSRLATAQPDADAVKQAQTKAPAEAAQVLANIARQEPGAELDLVAFVLPRALQVATSLQMALLLDQARQAQELRDIRADVVAQLVSIVAKTITLLANFAVKVDRPTSQPNDQGGVARAKALVDDIMRMMQSVFSQDTAAFPVHLHLEASTSKQDAQEQQFRGMQAQPKAPNPSLTIKSKMHAEVFGSIALRALCQTVGACTCLQGHWPEVLRLFVTRWSAHVSGESPRVPEIGGCFDAVYLELLFEITKQAPPHLRSLTLQATTPVALDALRHRAIAQLTDGPTLPGAENAVNVLLAHFMKDLWKHLRSSVARDDNLDQLLASEWASSGLFLKDAVLNEALHGSLRAACLFTLVSCLRNQSNTVVDVLATDFGLPAATRLENARLAPFSVASDLDEAIKAAIESLAGTGSESTEAITSDTHKRKFDEVDVPSSDIYEHDNTHPASLNRTRKPSWLAAVSTVLEEYGLQDQVKAAEEGLERLITRIANNISETTSTKQIVNVLKAFAFLPCARAGDLRRNRLSPDASATSPECLLCDRFPLDRIYRTSEPVPSRGVFRAAPLSAVQTLAKILDRDDDTIVLLWLQAFSRIAKHSHAAAASSVPLDGPASSLLWSMMRHRTRRIRVVAGHALTGLLVLHQRSAINETYRSDIFQSLDALLEEKHAAVVETGFLFAKQLTCFAEAQSLLERGLLERFVRGLGHRNLVLRHRIKAHLVSIASYRRIKLYALIQPHFSTIAPMLLASNTIFNACVESFGQSPHSLLQVTRDVTLPRSIEARSKAQLDQIAAASGDDVPGMLVDVASAVLAHVYMLPDSQLSQTLKFFLDQINSLGHDVDLARLIESRTVEIVYRLALELGDDDQDRVTQATRALMNVERHRTHSASKTKIELGVVLKNSIVGILSHMNRGLNESSAHRPLCEKQRIIRALAAVTHIVGPAISGYSPQIMATLQSALEVEGLRDDTLQAFDTFVRVFKFHEIGPYLGPISSLFVKLFEDFSPRQKNTARKILEYIVIDNSNNLANFVHDVADLSGIKDLSSVQSRIHRLRAGLTKAQRIEFFISRVSNENDAVAFQALKELQQFLSEQDWAKSATEGDSFDPQTGILIRTLLNAVVRDGADQKNVRDMALACLGSLGALDPARVEVPSTESPFIVLDNFENHDESIEFALHLIQDVLIGIYRSTNDTKHQEFLAFAIQTLLGFCGFTKDLLQPRAHNIVEDKTWARWSKLHKSVHETCGPLLGSAFTIIKKTEHRDPTFPVYLHTTSYRDWIKSLTDYLVQSVKSMAKTGRTSKDAYEIFDAFRTVLYLDDIAVAQYLLPHLVLNTLISGKDGDRELIRREMQAVLTDQVSPTHETSDHSRLLSAQTVFALMDHLSQWITNTRKRLQETRNRKRQKSRSEAEQLADGQLINVEVVLHGIQRDLLGQAAQVCKAYARSLLNFESHIVAERASKGNSDQRLQDYYERLHDCYAALDEPDGMEGISTKIISPSIQHQIVEHESTGRWTSAQSCWEVRLQQKPDDPANHVGLLRCLKYLGHYDSLRTHIAGVMQTHGSDPEWTRLLAPFSMEAALFAGDWSAVDRIIALPDADGPEIAFGKVLKAVVSGDVTQVHQAFVDAREQFGASIVAAGRESYRRVYDDVVSLHMLEDLRSLFNDKAVISKNETKAFEWLAKFARPRFEATSPSFRTREPILNVQRTALRLMAGDTLRNSVAKLWLQTSKIARKAGHTQTAYSAILQARDMNSDVAYQRAKLLKAMDEPTKAIQDLANYLQFRNGFITVSTDQVQGAESQVIASKARWLLEAGRLEHNDVVQYFTTPSAMRPNWEAPPFYLGKYMDEIGESLVNRKTGRSYSDERELAFRYETVKHYSSCLTYGTKFIYQALPRMLTIWLELGDEKAVLDALQAKKKHVPENAAPVSGRPYEFYSYFTKINKAINRSIKALPAYEWLTVLPQLVSRILHQNDTVWDALQAILLTVIRYFPQHGFWAMASGAKSNVSRRQRRNMKVFDMAKNNAVQDNRQQTVEILDSGLRLVDELLQLCNYPVSKTDNLSMRKTFPQLDNLLPLSLIIPIQSSLNVTLPASAETLANHKPFPDRLVKFQSFDDMIAIMSSLQRPRKITVVGDDGRSYSFLCKPKDDLRKDARLMEFNSMIIKLLKKDGDARSRHLDIRTYAVVPLNEDCGLIEWVPHTVVLRGILSKAYTARGISSWAGPGPELKAVFDTIRDDPKDIANKFEGVLKKFPPVFHEWFLENFPEPSAWLRARLSYSRTAAVISIVGFVLGLGDRHCENILLDSTTGDTVHVDFNCLFDRGRTFDVPEQVPFRLTNNIIDGMGVTGVEGVYRRAAEITLRILRTNRDSLMSVLETFLHDPLVEFQPGRRSKDSGANQAEHIQTKARNSLVPISNKLRGLQVTSAPDSLGVKEVSVSEQVERLIREARNSKNLGSMYVGW
ncbi:hypothetical protein OIV83_000739 [Microbotryomycetes sp. JL201]|nr:hypothetical protein OIV83_000739 [Microbotryomycetes sp. JL201]